MNRVEAARHPDCPPCGFWPGGAHLCPQHVRSGGRHLCSALGGGEPGPMWCGRWPDLTACSSLPEGPDSGRCARALSPTVTCSYVPGSWLGAAVAASGCGDPVLGLGGTSSCGRNPSSASSAVSAMAGQAPKWPPGLQWLPPCRRLAGRAPCRGAWGDRLLPGPSSWQPCQAVAGMEFPAFLVGRMASESYLLCLWHQLASRSRGRVHETRAQDQRTPGRLLLASSASPAFFWLSA